VAITISHGQRCFNLILKLKLAIADFQPYKYFVLMPLLGNINLQLKNEKLLSHGLACVTRAKAELVQLNASNGALFY
jgi:hypothetical protein